MDVSYMKSKISQGIDWLARYPLVVMIVVAFILVITFLNMRERQSSAGAWGVILICAFLFMWALGNLTGLGFGMSF